MTSDGVVFASPNYSFQVSAIMKKFLDRIGFVFRRPLFFGKTFTSIVARGIYGGDKIVVYLDFVGNGLGFTVKGSCFTALEPMTEKEKQKIDRALAEQAVLRQTGKTGLSRANVVQAHAFQDGSNHYKPDAR